MTKLVLTPADTFFFKNHHATQAGETTVMESMFPPRPNTIYGALRAAYIYAYSSFDEFARGADERVKLWMGTPDERGAFRLHYCALADGDSLFLPLPLDYQVVEEGDSLKAYPLQLAKDRKPSSASTMWRLASSRREKTKSSQHRYVSLSEWKKALLLNQPIASLRTLSSFIVQEEKVGIQLDVSRRTAQEGFLYRVGKHRFLGDSSLVAYIDDGPDFSNVKWARIGGENRPWFIRQHPEEFRLWNDDEKRRIEQDIQRTKMAKIIFLSPAIFANGSRPAAMEGDRWTWPNGAVVTWLAAAIGRPELYGGWDIVRHRPKPRKWMIPAGSVIYVKIERDDDLRLVFSALDGIHLTDEGAEEGFGFAVLASVHESEEEL
ncbi:type III-B CRISPR module-associated protein Cmr3 [Geobacillus sp. Y412MC52]|uniref:type III-B CRISPR module-associated protein Cmr3 n=1 Tax=Geobacillus sp. (strain Y412MC52) TaxID=550542 RepID=UPI00018C0EBB|nr:type III-B CRISPR module-associated protein Cmr3 [Geobacillus sp. Y412MC52]ADU92822.1 CRISPR-associated protein, Cmr3 [Geobacillus sp. Y412MC52]ALA70702.1 CRISPR-associated protein Cmr3 [Geobacillus stearothermophilus 10]